MRLDFNVLWVDDQPDRVEAQVAGIRKRMEEEGFEFNATLSKSIDEVRQLIGESVFTDEIDLILVDWDLGGQMEGQDAIAAIRESVPYKDVVFYSAHNSVDTLRKLAFDKGLEGVHCASREELVAEVLGVFDSLVKKVLDLDHTRGIVMGATSDIDYMVSECLVAVYDQFDDEGKAAMLKQALGYIEKRIREHAENAAQLGGVTSMVELLEAHELLTSNDRLRVLAGVLKAKSLGPHKGYRQSVTTYQQKVVPFRNKLGHMVLVPEGKVLTLIDNKGKVISLEETRDLRRVILGLRIEFRKLLLALQGHAENGAAPAGSAGGSRAKEVD